MPAIGPMEHHWFSVQKEQVLDKFIPTASVAIELGSWFGISAIWMLKRNPTLQIICIDHWKGDQNIRNAGCADLIPESFERFICNLWTYRDRTTFIKDSTINGMLQVWACGIIPDVIYIDASHDYISVLEDVIFAASLFPSAILCGDDWSWVNPPLLTICEKKGWKIENNDIAWWITKT